MEIVRSVRARLQSCPDAYLPSEDNFARGSTLSTGLLTGLPRNFLGRAACVFAEKYLHPGHNQSARCRQILARQGSGRGNLKNRPHPRSSKSALFRAGKSSASRSLCASWATGPVNEKINNPLRFCQEKSRKGRVFPFRFAEAVLSKRSRCLGFRSNSPPDGWPEVFPATA